MITSFPCLTRNYLRAGLTRLTRNALTTFWRPQSGWSPSPVLAVLRPTESCNLRCKMCFDRGNGTVASSWSAGPSAPELAEDVWRSLVAELARFRCSFYITGGEPLLAKATLPIIAAIKSHGGYVSLNTNGVLLKECAQELVASGLDKIIVSLDGPRHVHEAIRGASFDAMAEGIAAIHAVRHRRHLALPVMRAQCVISPDNVGALVETMQTARDLGFPEIRFQHLMFVSSEDSCRLDDFIRQVAIRARISAVVLPRGAIDLSVLKSQVAGMGGGRRHGIKVRFEPPVATADLDAYYENTNHGFVNSCLSPWRRLVVSPRGELGPCQGVYLGRYPEACIADIWNGAPFRAFRRRLMDQGLFSFCARCCHREYYAPRVGLDIS